ncbi:quercetin 2,3-dioxygenase [Saccharopolyspora elongata]|uniref:Cupin domain-containing protein n=1 Tax=Saccharopolyspora elongata TaxID=2530387 RepID=A0A4R4Z3X6_9PSEU|nr:quercetin 2,3-dioxygenase [Saccharopolyspora elongata]TDD52735.1 cupin domain-containing protein [Saccharopolyspora elongata]
MTMEFATPYRSRSHLPPEPGRPYFVEKGMGDRAHLFGDLITIYAGGEQTEGTFNFFTCEGAKGDTIPAHSHAETYEVFYVTAGAVRLFVEDTAGEQYEKLLGAGDFGFVPKNCPHAYRIERHHSQIVGVAAGPGGTFERFFENLGVPTEELGLPRTPAVPEPGKFATVPREYDVRFLPEHRWRTPSFRAQDQR